MRIFLSWSGDRSKYLAETFKEWLPNVLQYVDPYMSAKDIKLGERWSTNIEDNLREHDFGLVFVTPENINAPWINFEAGALTKNLKSRVIPIIFESEVSILNQGPLKQFQSQKQLDEDSIRDLIKNINSAETDSSRLSNERVDRSFDMWWNELQEMLKNVPKVTKVDTDNSESNKVVENEATIMILKKLEDIQRVQNKTLGSNIKTDMIKNVPINDIIKDYEISNKISINALNLIKDKIDLDDDELSVIYNDLNRQIREQENIFRFVMKNI